MVELAKEGQHRNTATLESALLISKLFLSVTLLLLCHSKSRCLVSLVDKTGKRLPLPCHQCLEPHGHLSPPENVGLDSSCKVNIDLQSDKKKTPPTHSIPIITNACYTCLQSPSRFCPMWNWVHIQGDTFWSLLPTSVCTVHVGAG